MRISELAVEFSRRQVADRCDRWSRCHVHL